MPDRFIICSSAFVLTVSALITTVPSAQVDNAGLLC
jgi:hypothetical protein